MLICRKKGPKLRLFFQRHFDLLLGVRTGSFQSLLKSLAALNGIGPHDLHIVLIAQEFRFHLWLFLPLILFVPRAFLPLSTSLAMKDKLYFMQVLTVVAGALSSVSRLQPKEAKVHNNLIQCLYPALHTYFTVIFRFPFCLRVIFSPPYC